MMVVDELVKNPGAWLSMSGETGIVISSRVRLVAVVDERHQIIVDAQVYGMGLEQELLLPLTQAI